jgi:Na+/H+ antiporter NhaD/arsenite permease-like protein
MESLAQIVAVLIFLVMFGLVISEKLERHIVTLICGGLTIVLVFGVCMRSPSAMWQTLNIGSLFTKSFWYSHGETGESVGINWATIIFIAGMMIMVEGMAASGFFHWLCLSLASLVKYKTIPIFITFMLVAAFLSMFIDSITVIMFLAAVTVELSRLLKFNPVPMIISEVFCANLGGSATMCGDPPNIIIGTALGYSFKDFISNTGVAAGISLVISIIYFYIIYRKELCGSEVNPDKFPDPKDSIHNQKRFVLSWIIFICAVLLLVTHAETGLTVAFIGVFIAAVTLISAGKRARILLKRIDYKTLMFFIGLFAVVGGLEQTGVLELVAQLIGNISGGNKYLVVAIIIWVSAIASAFVDNIPFAATMLPVIKGLSADFGLSLPVMAWALSIGTDIGGSATPIGASANVVGTSISARNGHPISWKKYCLAAVPATLIVLVVSTVYIFVRYL